MAQVDASPRLFLPWSADPLVDLSVDPQARTCSGSEPRRGADQTALVGRSPRGQGLHSLHLRLALPEAQLAAFLDERRNVRRFGQGDDPGIRDYPSLVEQRLCRRAVGDEFAVREGIGDKVACSAFRRPRR